MTLVNCEHSGSDQLASTVVPQVADHLGLDRLDLMTVGQGERRVIEHSEELRVTVTVLVVWQDISGEGVVNKRMGATLQWPPWSQV